MLLSESKKLRRLKLKYISKRGQLRSLTGIGEAAAFCRT